MTREEAKQALDWFRSRSKAVTMPGAKRMYLLAIEALSADGDTISRQAAMVVIENSGLDDDSKDTVVRVIEQLPSAEPDIPKWAQEVERMYDKALHNSYVKKPLAWALYNVWKLYDQMEVEHD